mgnify:CR=1 FL=1
MGNGWIVAAMEEKNCTEMEGDARQRGSVCVVCCVVNGMNELWLQCMLIYR